MSKKLKYIIIFSLIPQYLALLILKNKPGFVENYFSTGLYPIVSKLLNTAFKWIPISLGDLLYISFIIYASRWFLINCKRIKTQTKSMITDVLTTISIIYFLFHFCWGLNYYRTSLHTTLNLKTTYTTHQLKTITNELVLKTNSLHLNITNDSLQKTDIPYSFNELTTLSQQGYKELEIRYPFFRHPGQNSKKSLFSTPLSYMGFGGYLNPFTLEIQVNGLMPKTSLAITIPHEQAHQLGYAAENEANFIGFLACIYNKDLYYQYTRESFP